MPIAPLYEFYVEETENGNMLVTPEMEIGTWAAVRFMIDLEFDGLLQIETIGDFPAENRGFITIRNELLEEVGFVELWEHNVVSTNPLWVG